MATWAREQTHLFGAVEWGSGGTPVHTFALI